MLWEIGKDALEKKLCLELSYDGYARLVEVHAIGQTTAGNVVMRAWQVSGGSVSNEPTGWKLLRLDEAKAIAISETGSEAPRPGYKRGDRSIKNIYIEI